MRDAELTVQERLMRELLLDIHTKTPRFYYTLYDKKMQYRFDKKAVFMILRYRQVCYTEKKLSGRRLQ
jgi:hypothetical protein